MNVLSLPLGLNVLRRLPLPHKLGVLERLYGKTLGEHGIKWVECSNGVVWKLDLTDPTHRWIVYGDYQGQLTMKWVRSWLGEGGVVVDSGANIGQMLLYFAPLRGVSVYGFEPLPEAYEWLNECLEGYKAWDVELFDIGLGKTRCADKMQCDGARSTTNLNWYIAKQLPRISIRVDTLDNFVRSKSIASIRLWKLDVEGGEYSALEGAEKSLANNRIEAILLECNPRNFEQVRAFLGTRGYAIYQLNNTGLALAKGADQSNKDFIVLSSRNRESLSS